MIVKVYGNTCNLQHGIWNSLDLLISHYIYWIIV